MQATERRSPRKYNRVEQFFHNFEHDPRGLNHCHSSGYYPYSVKHRNGKHVITGKVAVDVLWT